MRLAKLFSAAISLVLLATMAVGCAEPGRTSTPVPTESEALTFPDENLEAAIRDALSKPPSGEITTAELTKLTELEVVYSGITNISGLQYCTNLTELILYQNQISDISPLSSLTSLTVLYLLNNQISDVSLLSSLTNLTELLLGWNQISDISSLYSLTSLTTLNLGLNQISDMSPLSSLTNLTTLYLDENPLSETSVNVIIPQLEERGVNVSW